MCNKTLSGGKLKVRVEKNNFGWRNSFVPSEFQVLPFGKVNIRVEKNHFGGRNAYVPREYEGFAP